MATRRNTRPFGAMILIVSGIPSRAKPSQVEVAIANTYHQVIRLKTSRETEMNFGFEWEEERQGTGRLRPTAVLKLPDWGQLFLKHVEQNPVMVTYNHDERTRETKSLSFSKKDALSEEDYLKLTYTPWQDPSLREQLQERRSKLERICKVSRLEFGFYHSFPRPLSNSPERQFVVEWNRTFDSILCQLEFLDQAHIFQFHIHDYQCTDKPHQYIKIRYENVKEITYQKGRHPIYTFSLWTPSVLECGPLHPDRYNRRQRLSGLDESHQRVISYYPTTIRATFYDKEESMQLEDMLDVIGLKSVTIMPIERCEGKWLTLQETRKITHQWLKKIDFRLAFQIASWLQNGIFNPLEIEMLRPGITALAKETPLEDVLDILSHFSIERNTNSNLETSFKAHLDEFAKRPGVLSKILKAGCFWCRRVRITPTTIRLEGPLPEQSNSIIRKYSYASQYFLRVYFTDEERTQLLLDKKVDGESFVRKRVGDTLVRGLEVAGRSFSFLAYSNSGLREHSVWFVTPFKDRQGREITADFIRNEIGDFTDTPLEYQPAKLGARLAQAFSATEPTITLQPDEVERREDIFLTSPDGSRREATDGYGTMSIDIAAEVWNSFSGYRNPGLVAEPRAYQIRMGGSKGILGVDYSLTGRKLVLRKSMIKFESLNYDLHVAKKFDRPMPLFLNRPLVAALEHIGFPIDWFIGLQESARNKAARTVNRLDEDTAEFFQINRLGVSYGLASIIRALARYKVTLKELKDKYHPQGDFLMRAIAVGLLHVDKQLKYKAHIPVPGGLTLVGIADIREELNADEVYICIQHPEKEMEWITGQVLITRSPSIHPGDIQGFKAITPPRGSIYGTHPMVNCLVFSVKGDRPPAHKLSGGDLDGDTFQIISGILEDPKFEIHTQEPAQYPNIDPYELNRKAEIKDIQDFVVNFINSDRTGVVATQHLIIGDQSKFGLSDKKCDKLAELHSKAVDFPKSGQAVNFLEIPKKIFDLKPDFCKKEVSLQHEGHYYKSPKALGQLFRRIDIKALESESVKNNRQQVKPIDHPITQVLINLITPLLPRGMADEQLPSVRDTFQKYAKELKAIKSIHTIEATPLSEEEVFMGTIVGQTAHSNKRDDLSSRLKEITGHLVDRVRFHLEGFQDEDAKVWLATSFRAWWYSLDDKVGRDPSGNIMQDLKGAQRSFGWIALGSAFESVDVINGRRKDTRRTRRD